MSDATEQLRAGLKERGIEYKAINRLVTDIQRDGLFIRVFDYGDDPDFQMCVETRCKTTTTEQAIEVIVATLGPGTCHNEAAPNCRDYWFCCSECEFVAHTNKTAINYCPNCGKRCI